MVMSLKWVFFFPLDVLPPQRGERVTTSMDG